MKTSIEPITVLGIEQFRGQLLSNEGEVRYEVIRWSEGGVRQALLNYLYTNRAEREAGETAPATKLPKTPIKGKWKYPKYEENNYRPSAAEIRAVANGEV